MLEIQKRFLDIEEIVQEAASTAFSIMLTTNKNRIEPFLPEIIKIVTTIFDKYCDTSILILHDITNLLTKHYDESFKNLHLIEELIKCIIKKLNEKISSKDFVSISYLLEIIPAIVKTSGYNIVIYIKDFLNATFEIIKNFHSQYKNSNNDVSSLDKDLINKCLDLISVIYSSLPNLMLEFENKNIITENIFKLLEINDHYIKHFVIAVIGDIGKIDNKIFIPHIKTLFNLLIVNLELNEFNKMDPVEIDKLSVCNNSCWTLGLLAMSYSQFITEFMKIIMNKLIKILKNTKVNFFCNF